MTTYFVSGHDGAVDWAKRRGIDATYVKHLVIEDISKGDTVIGTLPVHMAAEICEIGARYFHLILEHTAYSRQKPLTAEVMETLGARIEEYTVRKAATK